ncbi:MAG: NAD(P)/FAD-dependent oxidoreductase [Candidatus Pacebacteria bacterium]|nr:NAD(P)/FAD-dependent oxidoreductase [Candidatus Paceibacterota bacterium]
MEHTYDVIVIGGGAAGMTAAGKAAQEGAEVLLLEKNERLGKKLLITGRGRSNFTKAEFDPKEMAKKYGKEGAFLLSPLSVFGVQETISFFNKRGMATKIERGNRVFPKSNSSGSVLRVLLGYLKESKVEIWTDSEVRRIAVKENKISKIVLKNGQEIKAKNYILATGGKSFPGTGSTGEGYRWLESMGHKIEKLRPGLVPVKVKEAWPKRAQGLSLKNIRLDVLQNGRKQDSRFGEMIFTHFGISGPIVLDLSSKIGELLEKGEVEMVLDLKPALDIATLDKRLQSDFKKHSNKLFRNSLEDLLPQKLIPIVVEMSSINPEKKVNEITKEERQNLVKLLKGMQMKASGLLDFNSAIITQGGVSLKEIDAKTMKSKIISNLYLAGEIINLHGPTGGYNLQLCWSTGYLAGKSAAKK